MAVTTTPDKEVLNNLNIVIEEEVLYKTDDERYLAQEKEKDAAAQERADLVKDNSDVFLKDGMEIYQKQQKQANQERAKQHSDVKLELVGIDTSQGVKELLIEGLVSKFIEEINETLNPKEQITPAQQKKIVHDIQKEYLKAANKKNITISDNIPRKVFEKHVPKACRTYKKYSEASKDVEGGFQEERDNVKQQNNEPNTKFEKLHMIVLRAFTSPKIVEDMNLNPTSMAYPINSCGLFNINRPFRMQPQLLHAIETAEEEAEINKNRQIFTEH